MNFSQDYATGPRSESANEEVMLRACKTSLLIKFVTYPLTELLSEDDQSKFSEILVKRDKRYHSPKHPRWHVHVFDIVILLDLIRRYVGDAMGIVITIKFPK
ncbi:hypothetical protein BJP34_35680 (plasmid) [Moorena producens PAL-8-15-08-1]|uniref:Uncharacterized protein n=1 Tax=Moorena producens PAL-8-15-08-1 TaxID=1458985 RepID=A0A1D8U4H9_9CYAN|nr:hypothetical protein BJP34_35680 [Moorena producens PAL-8-15-08-1]